MFKKAILILLLIFITNCSVDTKTGFWEDKNKSKITTKLPELRFDYDTSFNKFKENVILYGKFGDYPKLDN
tara:strand:- start:401 stop:613 length:213 start_codon:yes stop_codon:yes gene_type:complete